MLQSENISELLAELVEVQSELPTMPKSSQAYGYKYTDLDTITQTIKPILSKHGIGYIQSVGGLTENALTLTTRIFNKKGEYIEDTAALPTITSTKNNAAQTLGMSITYMRRYALCAMLGITSDEDVDANINGIVQTQGSKPIPSKQETNSKQLAKFSFEPKGGETTPAEKKELGSLLSTKYPDGGAVFSKAEAKKYSDMRKDYTAREVIETIRRDLNARLNPTSQMQTAGDVMRAQAQQLPPQVEAVKNAFNGEVVTSPQQPSFDEMQPAGEPDGGIF